MRVAVLTFRVDVTTGDNVFEVSCSVSLLPTEISPANLGMGPWLFHFVTGLPHLAWSSML